MQFRGHLMDRREDGTPARLLFVFALTVIALHLDQLARRFGGLNLFVRKAQIRRRQLLQRLELLRAHIRLLILGKTVGKEAVPADPEQNDRPKSSRPATSP